MTNNNKFTVFACYFKIRILPSGVMQFTLKNVSSGDHLPYTIIVYFWDVYIVTFYAPKFEHLITSLLFYFIYQNVLFEIDFLEWFKRNIFFRDKIRSYIEWLATAKLFLGCQINLEYKPFFFTKKNIFFKVSSCARHASLFRV